MSLSQIELDWVRVRVEWECFWVNLREDNKVSEFKMAVAELIFGRIQDSCHHQVKWEWMSLNQIEIVWFRVRVEWECFWVNQREDNKVSESKMAVAEFNLWQNSRWLPSSSWVRMNEWSFFVQMVGTNLGKCEWVWEEILWWLNPSWPNSRWLPSSHWVRMN